MYIPLPPLSVTILIADEVFNVVSHSESGLTLPAGAAAALAPHPGRRLPAVLRLEAEGVHDHYDVEIRAARSNGPAVEVALVQMPAQARLRLRHARNTAVPPDRDSPPHPTSAANKQRQQRDAGRRLILGGSFGVLTETEDRRETWSLSSFTGVMREEDMARSYVLWAMATLALTSAVLIVLAVVLIATA